MRLPFPKNEHAENFRDLFADRDVFIHDFDGVHYDYADFGTAPSMFDFLADVKAQTMQKLIPGLAMEADELRNIGRTSYRTTGDGLLLFLDIAEEHGLDRLQFRRDIHTEFHRAKCDEILQERRHMFAPCLETNAAFNALRPHVRHGLLTQSSVENWAAPMLDHMGRLEFFEPHVLIGYEDCDFVSKRDSTAPLEMAIKLMNASPERVVFIEDSLDNLKMAKQLSSDILTVYCCHNEKETGLPDYVDMIVPKPKDLLQAVAATYQSKPRPVAAQRPLVFTP